MNDEQQTNEAAWESRRKRIVELERENRELRARLNDLPLAEIATITVTKKGFGPDAICSRCSCAVPMNGLRMFTLCEPCAIAVINPALHGIAYPKTLPKPLENGTAIPPELIGGQPVTTSNTTPTRCLGCGCEIQVSPADNPYCPDCRAKWSPRQ